MMSTFLPSGISASAALVLTFLVISGCAPAATEAPPESRASDAITEFYTREYRIQVVTVADGLRYPYSMAFLPDGDVLFTEMEGQLRLIRDGVLESEPIAGVPAVYHDGPQKGLMDIALHPDFEANNWVYLTYNVARDDGFSTSVLGRGVFDGTGLNDFDELFVADAWAMSRGRQNARLTFARDGFLYMTVGGGGEQAQEMDAHAGKIVRLQDDGTPAPGNPFLGREGYLPEIFTIGHQNVHGLVVHPETGDVWDLEHGDEANILRPGGNYGWPYASNGGGGSGGGMPTPFLPPPDGVELLEGHVLWSTPDIHPTGLMFYTGDRFPAWQGSLFVGGLRTEQLHRVGFDENGNVRIMENLFSNIGQWLRDVRQGPDGLIYFSSYAEPDAAGQIRRIEPVG